MILSKLEYIEFQDSQFEWGIEEFQLQKFMLVVGRNATGKTRTLNVIGSLTDIIAGRRLPNGDFKASFIETQREYNYHVKIEQGEIVTEELSVDGVNRIERDAEGNGEIWQEGLGRMVDFGLDKQQLAISARKDRIQTPYLEPLVHWAVNSRHFRFNDDLGRQEIIALSGPVEIQADVRRQADVSKLLLGALANEQSAVFKDLVIGDLNAIGYEAEDIGFISANESNASSNIPPNAQLFFIKEKQLASPTTQIGMSQGLFRAFSLLVHLNFSFISNLPNLLLIDDIGEGLDYERSKALIQIVVERLKDAETQLILSSNDRFIMNAVPLEHWNVIVRDATTCRIVNKANSGKTFEDFEFTGLSNFDFLTSEFWNENSKQSS